MRFFSKKSLLIVSVIACLVSMFAFISVSAASVKNATALVNGEGVNLREKASKKSKSITVLKDNTKLTVKKVVYNSSTSNLAKNKWYYVVAKKKKGYIRSDFVNEFKYTIVNGKTTDTLNYRVGAGTKFECKGTFKKGQKINIVLNAQAKDSKDAWYRVKVGTKYYYTCAKYVKLIDSEKKEEDKKKDDDKKKTTKVTFQKIGINHPVTIPVGASFNMGGIIKCSHNMKKAKIGIIDSDGDWMSYVTKNIDNSKIFKISSADPYVHFGVIIPGKYKYVGQFYVNNKWQRFAFSYTFTVKAYEQDLTNAVVNARLKEMTAALNGKYFTTTMKKDTNNCCDKCNVVNVVKKNTNVKDMLKKYKGSTSVNTNLFPHHYNPSGASMTLGWSCCGFAGFAGWYIGSKDNTTEVQYAIAKMGITYNKSNMKKYARSGDLVRTPSHSFMIIGVNNDGCKVIDSNAGRTCKVSVHTIYWWEFDVVTLSRAINRK